MVRCVGRSTIGGGGGVTQAKSFSITIQSATSNTYTIPAAVDTAKTVVIWNGTSANSSDNYSDGERFWGRLSLTNSTTITATINSTATAGGCIQTGSFVEYPSASIASIQYGTISIATNATSNTATVSATSTGKYALYTTGKTCTAATSTGDVADNHCFTLSYNGTTTVTCARASASANTESFVVGFVLVEFN